MLIVRLAFTTALLSPEHLLQESSHMPISARLDQWVTA
jgi:hypothetical protein